MVARAPHPATTTRTAGPDLVPRRGLAHLVHHPPGAPDTVLPWTRRHLHVDLLPRRRAKAWAGLMTTMLALLATDGAPGVHLGTGPGNTRALGFYDRLGFTELLRAPDVVYLGRPLP